MIATKQSALAVEWFVFLDFSFEYRNRCFQGVRRLADGFLCSFVGNGSMGLAVIADEVEGSQKGTYHTQIGTFEL